MYGNSLGKIFRLTTFGESHGKAIGGIIDGCPAGIELQESDIQKQLDRRRPGQSSITTDRKESDIVELLSGVFEGKTTGTPIGFLIPNKDQKSKDYTNIKDVFRPSHADYTYQVKYGIRDYRGGGRASARETANWVVGGSVAQKIIGFSGIEISSYVSQVGTIGIQNRWVFYDDLAIDASPVRCPDVGFAGKMVELIEKYKEAGDSLGGKISVVIRNVVAGIGRPVFSKLSADLSHAMFSINAVKAVEIGIGANTVFEKGSEQNDEFVFEQGEVNTTTNNSGGIQGGISNGSDILISISFKPPATILQKQNTVSDTGENLEFEAVGRHDPCVVPRAVPIVKAMCAMVLADHLLLKRTDKI
jgi:chorismate synthase